MMAVKSPRQGFEQHFYYTAQRIRELGLEQQITLLFKDYRELEHSYR
ncbi:hypothetical protein [Alishewanella longhuensis]